MMEFLALLSIVRRRHPSRRGVARRVAHAGGFAPGHTTETHLRVLKQFYWDTALSASPSSLPALFAVADPTHILYGSDWPFAPAPAVRFIAKQLEKYPMDAPLRITIDHGNAELLSRRG